MMFRFTQHQQLADSYWLLANSGQVLAKSYQLQRPEGAISG